MKALVMFKNGGTPQFIQDFPAPKVNNENEVLVTLKAAAIKNLDKSKASGTHYSDQQNLNEAKVIGGDGVGILADGTRVFAFGEGMLAEKAVVQRDRIIKLPDGISDAVAAALPNAVAGSAMALRFRAEIKAGETVLINGATGFTGRIAVQIAKYYGAKKIIATGRNQESLEGLLALGADEIISTQQNDEDFISQLKQTHDTTPIDIVIDYLWGKTAESILEVVKGDGHFTHRTRFVSIGSVTGDKIQLSAQILRSVDLQLSGSGLGSWTKSQMQELFTQIIPEMLQLAVDHKLIIETQNIQLGDIASNWDMNTSNGKRWVAVF